MVRGEQFLAIAHERKASSCPNPIPQASLSTMMLNPTQPPPPSAHALASG